MDEKKENQMETIEDDLVPEGDDYEFCDKTNFINPLLSNYPILNFVCHSHNEQILETIEAILENCVKISLSEEFENMEV